MSFTIRPAVRENTPLIIGIAGPSKSGKTYSAHRVAQGIARGGPVVMINAEGARGHQYAERFKYLALDIAAPFSYERYDEALGMAAESKPACVIVDSVSHAHDGPGGMIEQHEAELDRRAGNDYKKRDRLTWSAWIEPKKWENRFIYRMLGMDCPIILCFRAKEKLKIVAGKEPVDLGYQAIASDKISFETIFSLLLPPRCKGVPDLALSDLREPFEDLLRPGEAIDEGLGERLAAWAAGAAPVDKRSVSQGSAGDKSGNLQEGALITTVQSMELEGACLKAGITVARLLSVAKVESIDKIHASRLDAALKWVRDQAPTTAPDEATTLQRIDAAKDADAAAEVLDLARDQPFYARASEAYRNRWQEEAGQ